jgi:hypothetical protein
MAYVKRAVMTQRIVDILVEFGGFVQQNKDSFLGNDRVMGVSVTKMQDLLNELE